MMGGNILLLNPVWEDRNRKKMELEREKVKVNLGPTSRRHHVVFPFSSRRQTLMVDLVGSHPTLLSHTISNFHQILPPNHMLWLHPSIIW